MEADYNSASSLLMDSTPNAFAVTEKPRTTTEDELDVPYIVALSCFGVGGVLILVAFIKIVLWWINYKKRRKYSKWWLRQLEHKRYLEEYSIRTGDISQISVPSHYGSWTDVNDVTPDEESPPANHIDVTIEDVKGHSSGRGKPPHYGGFRSDKNMNDIMAYL